MGVLGIYRDSVNLVNRTTRDLNVRYDGEDLTLSPGENPGFPRIAVPYAKKQNFLKGSKHPSDPRQFICLVGVKAGAGEKQKDDISPIVDEVMLAADKKLEAVDRSGEIWGEEMRPVRLLKKTGYTNYEAQCAIDSDFSSGANIE